MFEKYRHYFNIDPDYFPQVNEAVMRNNPDMWKKYYPHTTFVKLISDTVKVLERKQKLSVWVEGAYGTGKSHAVLTLKKLLDASAEDTREYFEKYGLDMDLCNKLQSIKSGEQKVLTVHRYGSSSIRGDHNLVFAIQESIEQAMADAGIENKGSSALKEAVKTWLSDNANKAYFNTLITENYSDLFGGDNVDKVLEKLNAYSGDALIALMDKIARVSDERQMKMLSMDTKKLCDWIKETIIANDLKAIVFIWDEFTEYFYNNSRNLTGFQEIVDMSATDPFYLVIVTHKSSGLFDDSDKDKSKILDRFVKPTCIIELPENMAFQLMGAAMEKNEDEAVKSDWEITVGDLYERTHDSRQLVKSRAKITDEELKNILPIHPYTALLLKHISSAFDSNQRSMFDFIKNDRGDDIKGFQWFIDNFGPEDDNPLLTIDMLWEFFYDKGKEYLSHDIRSILDCYSRSISKKLDTEEQRVLKTVLLLQAISQKVGDTVELFIPNEKNVNNAFEGSDIEHAASRIAEKLCREEVLYKKPLGGGAMQYSAMVNAGDMAAIEKLKEEVKKKTTSSLITDGALSETMTLNGALKLRYRLEFASVSDFEPKIKMLRNKVSDYTNNIFAVVTFAKDDSENAVIGKKIKDALSTGNYDIVFIDASSSTLGKDAFDQYVDAAANAMYQRGKDNSLANQYDLNSKEVLKKWRKKIIDGEFIVYTNEKPEGEKVVSIDALFTELAIINKRRYNDCLEGHYTVTDTMYMANSLKLGVECGINRNTSGPYKSGNPATKLEKALEEVWDYDGKYWEDKPYLLISKIKSLVEGNVKTAFDKEGRISIASIYETLKDKPYGIMPCNLTAFILGFVLREYTDGSFSWSDGLTTVTLDSLKLKEMIDEVIKNQVTPNPRYRDKYIVTMTDEERSFNSSTSVAFGISESLCTSVNQTRERIRGRMKELVFPIWTVKYAIDSEKLTTPIDVIKTLIDDYCGIANTQNIGNSKTENDLALEIGRLCIEHKNAANDLNSLLNKESCIDGMTAYLKDYKDGLLIKLADQIDDNGQFINVLKKKFDADAANWVWNKDTVDQKIEEVILEYKIIAVSNNIISKNISFDNTIKEWADKCSYIRISFAAAKNYLGSSAPLFEILHTIKKTGVLQDSKKAEFLSLLEQFGDDFRSVYANQVSLFRQVCAYYLDDLSDDEISDLFTKIPSNCFTKEKSEYSNLIDQKVKEFRSQLGSQKLKKLWKEKTGTESPRDWSRTYKMPILAMIDEKDVQKAKTAFAAINRKNSDSASIDNAINYIESANIYDKLNSKEARDTAFVSMIIKDYAVMLTDIDEVKNYLSTRINADAYDWFGLPEVDTKLKRMAEAKYDQGGCDIALEKIDSMDVADVKRYLKDLIKQNMRVGIEIIKEN